jgi:hypothetical protein
MKKLSFLFVSIALVAFVSLNSCKTTPKPAEDAVEEVVEEEVVETQPVDTLVVESAETAEDVVE